MTCIRIGTLLLMAASLLFSAQPPAPTPATGKTAIVASADTNGIEEEIIIETSPSDAVSPEAQAPADSIDPADSLPPIEIKPAVIKFVKALYPPDLVKKGITGTVIMDMVIDTLGRVDSVWVVKGTHPQLDSNAVAALRGFVFSPALLKGGQPVAVVFEYAYTFTLDEVVERVTEYVNFSGRLIERGTRAPIQDATVILTFTDTLSDTTLGVPFGEYLKKIGSFEGQYLEAGKLIAITDSLGRFSFKSLPACTIGITIPVSGYEQFKESEKIGRSEATTVTYYMARLSYAESEYEIVVYGKAEKKEVSKQTLTLNEVRKIPGLGGDAVKVVQALPGVARSPFGSGGIVVRGSGNGDTRYLLDGTLLPLLFHFGGLKSTYNSDALESVDLYPGGFGVRYGNALGGIIEIKGRKAKTDRFHGYLDANLFDASFLIEGPVTKQVSVMLSARRSYIANVLAFALDKVLKQSLFFTAVPFYWDYIARVDIDPLPGHHVFVTGFGAKDRMDLITKQVRGGSEDIDAETNRLRSEQYFHMGILGWDWNVTNKLKSELRYAPCYYNGGVAAFGFFKFEEQGTANSIREQLGYSLTDKVTLFLGTDILVNPDKFELTLTDADNNIVKSKTEWTFGPYAGYFMAEWKPNPSLTITPGVRYDYYPQLRPKRGALIPEFWNYAGNNNRGGSRGEPAVRLSVKDEYIKGQIIKGSLGTYSQSPSGQAIHPDWGNPDLPAQKGSQYVVGHEWKITDLISSDVQAYYNQQWDLERQPSLGEYAQNPLLPIFISNGKARMWGLEVMLKHNQSSRFFGWIAYSLSRSERWSYEENAWDLFGQDQTHNLQFIGSLRFPGNRELGTRIRYVTGNPTTPVLGNEYYDATYRYYRKKYGPHNSARVDPFFSVDLRYERKFAFKNWMFDVYLDITNLSNLFGYGYVSPETGGYIWNYDNTEKQVLSDITRPALGLRFEF